MSIFLAACTSSLAPASEYMVSTLVDAYGEPIRFRRPERLAIDSDGNLYVAESLGGIWRVSPWGIVENLVAGVALSLPAKMSLGDDGILYITESAAHRVISVGVDGTLNAFAGTGEIGYADGDAARAHFFLPLGIAASDRGDLFIADSGNNRVRQITAGGRVSTAAGGGQGYVDGSGSEARLWFPQAVAVDAPGVIYVADSGNGSIRIVKRGE